MRCTFCGGPISKLFDADGICSLCLIEEQNSENQDFIRALGATEFLDVSDYIHGEYDEICD